jgi:hypothetical protein
MRFEVLKAFQLLAVCSYETLVLPVSVHGVTTQMTKIDVTNNVNVTIKPDNCY